MAGIHHLSAVVWVMYGSHASLQDCQEKYPRELWERGGKELKSFLNGRKFSYLWELERKEGRRGEYDLGVF